MKREINIKKNETLPCFSSCYFPPLYFLSTFFCVQKQNENQCVLLKKNSNNNILNWELKNMMIHP